MPKSAFSDAHAAMVRTLIAARHQAGLLQAELAAKLGKDQSFISNIERGERRVDVVEFHAISTAMGINPVDLFRSFSDQVDGPASI